MNLSPEEHARYRDMVWDFSADHEPADEFIRSRFKIPQNRFYSVMHNGRVIIDPTRTREVRAKKLSKSDQ